MCIHTPAHIRTRTHMTEMASCVHWDPLYIKKFCLEKSKISLSSYLYVSEETILNLSCTLISQFFF